jgi:hypothetical protein
MKIRHVIWNGGKEQKAVDALLGSGGMIVSATNVGYIIMTTDRTDLGASSRRSNARLTNLAWSCAARRNSCANLRS